MRYKYSTLALMFALIIIGGLAAQTALEPRVAVLEYTVQTHSANFTAWACGHGGGTCNPVFATATQAAQTPQPTATTAAITPYATLNTPTQEAWVCGRVTAANGLTVRNAPTTTSQISGRLLFGAVVAYDADERVVANGYTWVKLLEPVGYNGRWVALQFLGKC